MKIDDLVLEEVNYSCAYCGQRGKENLSKHHIDKNKKNNGYDNLIILCFNCHHRLTNGKGITKSDILKIKCSLIKITLTRYGVNAIKISYRNKVGIVAMPYLVLHLVDLGYLSKKETQMGYGGIEVSAFFTLTKKGKLLYEKWLVK